MENDIQKQLLEQATIEAETKSQEQLQRELQCVGDNLDIKAPSTYYFSGLDKIFKRGKYKE